MSFRRLTAGHWLALIGALALLLAMSPDWYSDKAGEQNRYLQDQIIPSIDRETEPRQSELHGYAAEEHEMNAWQASSVLDRLILALLLITAALAIAAAFLRAADRDVGPPSPSAVTTIAGIAAIALVTYRIFEPPGLEEAAVVKWGAPLGLICVAVVALGSRLATLAQRDRPSAAAPAPAAEPGDS